MPHNKAKLIAVTSLNKLMLFKAQGLKVIEKVADIELGEVKKEHSHEVGKVHNRAAGQPGSNYQSKTSESDIEHDRGADLLIKHLTEFMSNHTEYNELMLSASPKLLGCLRNKFPKNLHDMLTKESDHDLTHNNLNQVEKHFFSNNK